jgi:hypothetical protein
MTRTAGSSTASLHGAHTSRRRGATSLLLTVALAACATDASGGVTAVQFQDVVVPNGMRLKNEGQASYSTEAATYRKGRFEYVGSTDLEAAASYVRERMPQHSWTKLRDEAAAEAGLHILFERGIYRADYTFTRSDGVTVMVVDYTTNYTSK